MRACVRAYVRACVRACVRECVRARARVYACLRAREGACVPRVQASQSASTSVLCFSVCQFHFALYD